MVTQWHRHRYRAHQPLGCHTVNIEGTGNDQFPVTRSFLRISLFFRSFYHRIYRFKQLYFFSVSFIQQVSLKLDLSRVKFVRYNLLTSPKKKRKKIHEGEGISSSRLSFFSLEDNLISQASLVDACLTASIPKMLSKEEETNPWTSELTSFPLRRYARPRTTSPRPRVSFVRTYDKPKSHHPRDLDAITRASSPRGGNLRLRLGHISA